MAGTAAVDLREFVRDVPDFPQEGILFRDITPLLASPVAFGETIRLFVEKFHDMSIDAIVAAEARGFIFAAPLALQLHTAFVPIRKTGKLPPDTHSFAYDLEYGSDTLEIHVDGLDSGQNVLVMDDLLATGGTVDACCQLVERAGANVIGCAFLIHLLGLGGLEKIGDRDVFSLIEYDCG